jgi:hypothetical protein
MSFYQFLLWLHLPFLMMHEIEEYVLSPVSFKEFFNLKTPFGSKTDPNYPLDEGYVFQVNIVIAWPMVILGAFLANIAPWVGFSMMLFELTINNIMHTILFQTDKPKFRSVAAACHNNIHHGPPFLYLVRLGSFSCSRWSTGGITSPQNDKPDSQIEEP